MRIGPGHVPVCYRVSCLLHADTGDKHAGHNQEYHCAFKRYTPLSTHIVKSVMAECPHLRVNNSIYKRKFKKGYLSNSSRKMVLLKNTLLYFRKYGQHEKDLDMVDIINKY